MTRYIESPDFYVPQLDDGPAVFLAGDTAGEDWQARAYSGLADTDVVVLNPRRAGGHDAGLAEAARQAAWTAAHRRMPRLVMLFWFPATTAATLAAAPLLELGAELSRPRTPLRRLTVGAAAGHCRRGEILLHCANERPDLLVHHTLEGTIAAAVQELSALGAGRPHPARLRPPEINHGHLPVM